MGDFNGNKNCHIHVNHVDWNNNLQVNDNSSSNAELNNNLNARASNGANDDPNGDHNTTIAAHDDQGPCPHHDG